MHDWRRRRGFSRTSAPVKALLWYSRRDQERPERRRLAGIRRELFNEMIELKRGVVVVFPASPYVGQQDGALRIAGTRVSLASVVTGFLEGESPEEIVRSFPALTLAQVYGAIAYYLDHQKRIDNYFAEVDRDFEASVPPLSQSNPELFHRLRAAQEKMVSKRS